MPVIFDVIQYKAPTMYYLTTSWWYVATFKLNKQASLNNIHIILKMIPVPRSTDTFRITNLYMYLHILLNMSISWCRLSCCHRVLMHFAKKSKLTQAITPVNQELFLALMVLFAIHYRNTTMFYSYINNQYNMTCLQVHRKPLFCSISEHANQDPLLLIDI